MGISDGSLVGSADGDSDGAFDGISLGAFEGALLGGCDGKFVGLLTGASLGGTVGECEGSTDGDVDGTVKTKQVTGNVRGEKKKTSTKSLAKTIYVHVVNINVTQTLWCCVFVNQSTTFSYHHLD